MLSALPSTIPLLMLTMSLYHSQLLNNTGSSSNVGSNRAESGRLLSIFSVVKFHHSECVSGTSTGLCMAVEEVTISPCNTMMPYNTILQYNTM